MAGPETRLVWNRIRKHLKPLHPQRIESFCTPGFPDVEMVGCTLELKYEKNWPKRESTKLNVDSLTKNPNQRGWWRKREKQGGRCFVLLRVADDWLLFWGVDAADYICYSTKLELEAVAIKVWHNNLEGTELCKILNHHRS